MARNPDDGEITSAAADRWRGGGAMAPGVRNFVCEKQKRIDDHEQELATLATVSVVFKQHLEGVGGEHAGGVSGGAHDGVVGRLVVTHSGETGQQVVEQRRQLLPGGQIPRQQRHGNRDEREQHRGQPFAATSASRLRYTVGGTPFTTP